MKLASLTPINTPIEATVKVPGSKSYTNRALLIAAVCKEPVKIIGPLVSEDTEAMIGCLQELGVSIDMTTDNFTVNGSIDDISEKQYELDAGLSGITIRFITALSCIIVGKQIISGKDSLNKRPIGDLVNALRELGAEISYLDKEGFPPIKVTSSALKKSETTISGGTSSQYLSALLLISPLLKNGLSINVSGRQVSRPYIDMTLDIMKYFGVIAENKNYKEYKISPSSYKAEHYRVEGDFSGAGYFFAIAALTKSKITVENLNPNSNQADKKFLNLLVSMGSKAQAKQNSISFIGNGVLPMYVDMEKYPDQAMTMAVLAAFADGKTVINGVRSLRIKETERVAAIENELAKMGINTKSSKDQLVIDGGSPTPANIDTYGDHRLAMSFAVAATKVANLQIINPEVVNKTFPGFWDEMAQITKVEHKKIEPGNVVLIGMRGTGKSTIGRLLAEKLDKKYVDTDDYIAQKAGKTVIEVVEDHGWEHFRKLEAAACSELANLTNHVISTGGGIILKQDNINNLRKDAVVILLKADLRLLARRVERGRKRPALTNENSAFEELRKLWVERKYKYYASSDFVVDCTKSNPRATAQQIVDRIKAND